ncbi:MAG: hypothetical protein HY744_27845 [Deltaproteobacteria bacterium]|nr:hypothetical protein [Deltaproteobacteria bacterium]
MERRALVLCATIALGAGSGSCHLIAGLDDLERGDGAAGTSVAQGGGGAGDGCPGSVPVQDCYTGPPNTVGVGACRSGVRICHGAVATSCLGEVTPVTELCNGRDDDCDGAVDGDLPGCTGPYYQQWVSYENPYGPGALALLTDDIAVAIGFDFEKNSTWLMRSTSAGKSWTKVHELPKGASGYRLERISDSAVLASSGTGSSSPALLSTDAGKTWSDAAAALPSHYWSYAPVAGVVFGSTPNSLLVTDDLGSRWETQCTRSASGLFFFGGAAHGISWDGPAAVTYTKDAGQSWAPSSGVPENYEERISWHWSTPTTVFLGGRYANLLRSTDGGASFAKSPTPYGKIRYNDFAFWTKDIGFAVACGNLGTGPGYLAITYDGGASWQKPGGLPDGIVHGTWCSRAVAVGPGGTVLAAGDASAEVPGVIWRSVPVGAP